MEPNYLTQSELESMTIGIAESPLLLPDIILPGQLNVRPENPDLRLMLAVFVDAIVCAKGNATGNANRKRERAEALDWFTSNKFDWPPITFLYLCQVFNFDPITWRRFVFNDHHDPATNIFKKFRLVRSIRTVVNTKQLHELG
jgi:hypothetical protein